SMRSKRSAFRRGMATPTRVYRFAICHLLFPPGDLIGESVGPVHGPDGLDEGAAVDGDGAVGADVVDEVAREAGEVAVEDEADELAVLVDDGGAGVAADDVGGADEVEGSRGGEAVLGLEPGGRELEAFLALALGGPLVDAGEGGEGGDGLAFLAPAFDLAEGDAEGEGGVGVDGVAESGEAGRGDL